MAYTPQNLQIFTAAFAGSLAGMGLSDRNIVNTSASAYAGLASVAGAFAQAVDTAWGVNANQLDLEAIQSNCAAFWQERSPNADSINTNPSTWANAALAIVATVQASEAYFTDQGIVPPAIPGGFPAGGGNYAANLTALGLVPTGSLNNGVNYFVGTLATYFSLDAQSTATVDGITVIAAQAGGCWLRNLTYGNPKWLEVANWYIDATNGNDENNGQAQVPSAGYIGPLKTFAELTRRWARGQLNPPLNATYQTNNCKVYILTDLPTTDRIVVQGITFASSSVILWITGELGRTTRYTGTIASVTPLNPATNQDYRFSDAGLNPTAQLNKRCRITTAGARLNTCWFIAKDLGANTARISTPGIPQPLLPAAAFSLQNLGYNQTTPQVGDTYVVEDLPSVTLVLSDTNANGQQQVQWGDLNFRNGGTFKSISVTPITYVYASYLNAQSYDGGSTVQNCFTTNGSTRINGIHNVYGGMISSANVFQCLGGSVFIGQMFLCQGSPLTGTNLRVISSQIWDCAISGSINPGGHGVVIGKQVSSGRPNTGYIGLTTSPIGTDIANGGQIMGSGNAGKGLWIAGDSSMTVPPSGAVLSVTGTGGDFQLDNGTTSRAWDEAGGAYTAARNNTWTLLATTIGGGGFGGSAHNVQSNAHIIQSALG